MADIPSFVNEQFKQKFTATVLAESQVGQENIVRWVYDTRTRKAGGVKGLEGSSAYKNTEEWYMVYLHILGDKANGAIKLPTSGPRAQFFVGYATVADYCDNNPYAKSIIKSRTIKVRKLIDEVYSSANPYEGWMGQGSFDDINREDMYWKSARAYYWLQQDSKAPVTKYVEILPGGKLPMQTQFIFNAEEIAKYFKTHDLPKDVKKFTVADVPK